MDNIISFFFRSITISAILYAYYVIFLKDRKLNHLNRIFLLSIFPVSIALPFLQLSFLQWQLPERIAATMMPATGDQHAAVLVLFVGALGYISIAGGLLLAITYKVYRIYRLKHRSQGQVLNGFWFVQTDDPRAPFSFFNNLFWMKGTDLVTHEGNKILEHETIHIRQHHSYDRLFGQVCCAVCWINPLFWRIQLELATVHEFLADEGAVDEGDTETFARMILLSYSQGRYLSPDLGFSKSGIERRIAMLSRVKERSSIGKKVVMAAVFALFLTGMLTATSYTHGKAMSGDRIKMIEQMEQKLKDERSSLGLPL